MDDMENMNPLMNQKLNFYDHQHDYSEIFIKKCFDFNLN